MWDSLPSAFTLILIAIMSTVVTVVVLIPIQQLTPRAGGGGSKGKGTDDPIRFLPVLPLKRSKPEWHDNPPSFILSTKSEDEQQGAIDLVRELTARE